MTGQTPGCLAPSTADTATHHNNTAACDPTGSHKTQQPTCQLPLPLPCRRDLVLASETSEELAELLQDLGQLRVVPLLQALLFDA